MILSAPIYRLKRAARALSRTAGIPLHAALDRIARREGYASWSLLAAKYAERTTAQRFYFHLKPGDLALIGARPGQGKTRLGIELAAEAVQQGRPVWFFSLEETEGNIAARFRELGVYLHRHNSLLTIDCSDAISATHIIGNMGDAPRQAFAVVDYLQLLDQRRERPSLEEQVAALKRHGKTNGFNVIFISQVDRSYNPHLKSVPDISDLRLPNALDVGLFDKACFLHGGAAEFHATRQGESDASVIS